MRGVSEVTRDLWSPKWTSEWLKGRSEVNEHGCWIWQRGCDKKGYGRVSSSRLPGALVHRISYVLFKGDIPRGMTVDHLCEAKSCINPDHLEVVSIGENARRWYQKQTACKNGHPYTAESTKYTHKGTRFCGICLAASIERAKNRRAAA